METDLSQKPLGSAIRLNRTSQRNHSRLAILMAPFGIVARMLYAQIDGKAGVATRYLSVLLAVVLCGGTLTFGQTDRATITGTISDSTGAVINGVSILATSTDTGIGYSGITNEKGVYTIPGLPVGTYAVKCTQQGFKEHVQTGIILIAAQVLELNVHMTLGATTETVNVSGGVPLLETETTSVQMTMEESALRDLPLDATGGRDALNLLLATTPLVSNANGGQQTSGGTQNWNSFAGQETMTNSVYVDGIESFSGIQGQIATPGLDALSETQLITSPSDAEFGTGGGVEMFQIKSGTNQLHGSAFEFLENEDLNANSWSNNYYGTLCAPGDTSCRAANSRGFDRFNDYGASAGGPIWKNHSFIFGDFEIYKYRDYQLNPNSVTVPTPQMLTGDFSQLLTGGVNQGDIPGPNGTPWINPCTGQPYQYGQIFDPETQQVINGVTCATPFQGNIIPDGRISNVSKQVAALYSKYYTPTLDSRIIDNFASFASSSPSDTKFTLDFKFDYTFSARHHLSAGLNHVSWLTLGPANSGINDGVGPLSSDVTTWAPNNMYRVVDTFSVTPTLLNTVGLGFSENRMNIEPQNPVNPETYGITGPTTPYFPRILYDGQSSDVANGVLESDLGANYQGFLNTNAFQYQDTVQWTKGRHSLKFGGTIKDQQLNTTWGLNLQTINFYGDTGGPTDPGLTPYVGFAFANQMLGNVQSASVAVKNSAYPRKTQYALFVQDDYKATPKLTLNLGLRWDVTGRLHEKNGRLQNFDLTAQNPAWGGYLGAWVFSKGPGTSFETNEDYHQFGPHLGGAYQITDKLVGRASYGLFFVPDGQFNTPFGGGGGGYTATQTMLAAPVNQVVNSVPGTIAYNWDQGYPGVNVLGPQNSTNSLVPSSTFLMWTHPDFLHLGYTQNWYAGLEYAVNKTFALNLAYVANRGKNLHLPGRSFYRSYPSFSTYDPLLLSGHVNDTISNASEAAADGVPYPFPGFSGPAYAAIAPYPQIASVNGATLEVVGDPKDGAVSAFNSFVIESKARAYHGLFLDFSYTLSKETGSNVGLDGFANNWGDYSQNLADWADEKHWVQYLDQRHLAKGYVTYALPIGKGQKWLPGSSRLLNAAVGGWEVGYYGSYGSGLPFALIYSPFQLPGFFNNNCGVCDRANFAPGVNGRNMKNHFSGHLDLANVNDPSNTDFDSNLFTATTAAAPFGNTPFTFNHWRWNPGVAHENMSLLKHIAVGEHAKATVGCEFFNVFNRHYYGQPNTGLDGYGFGQVTSVSGYRYGQVSARVEW